jgi:hypothetical protein
MKKKLKQFIAVLIISTYSVVNCFGDAVYFDIVKSQKSSALRPISTGQKHSTAEIEKLLQVEHEVDELPEISTFDNQFGMESDTSLSEDENASTPVSKPSFVRRLLKSLMSNKIFLVLSFIFMPSITMAKSAAASTGAVIPGIMSLPVIDMPFVVSASLIVALLVIFITAGQDIFMYRKRTIVYDERPAHRTKYIKHMLGIAFWILLTLFVQTTSINITSYVPMNRNSEAAQADVHSKWRSLDSINQVLPDGTQVTLNRQHAQTILAEYERTLEGASSEINIKDPDPRNQAAAVDALRYLTLYDHVPSDDTVLRIISFSVNQPGDDESVLALRYAARQTLAHLGKNQADMARAHNAEQADNIIIGSRAENLFKNQRSEPGIGQKSFETVYSIFADKIGIIMDSTYGSLAFAVGIYLLVTHFLWNRKRFDFYTVADDKKHKIAFWTLNAVKTALILVFVISSGIVTESSLQRKYISSYFNESPEQGLVIPVDKQILTPDFLNLDRAAIAPEISPYNAIGVVIDSMINTQSQDIYNSADRSSSIRLLAQLLEDVSVIPEQDLNNIFNQLFVNESFVNIFQRFVVNTNPWVTDGFYRRIFNINESTIQRATVIGKQNLIRDFVAYYIKENYSNFSFEERQAATRFFWALRTPDIRELSFLIPVPQTSDIQNQHRHMHEIFLKEGFLDFSLEDRQAAARLLWGLKVDDTEALPTFRYMPQSYDLQDQYRYVYEMSLFSSALQQSVLSVHFSHDYNFVENTTAGLQNGDLSLIIIPSAGRPYRNEILEKLFDYPIYELPKYSFISEYQKNIFLTRFVNSQVGMESFQDQILSGESSYIIVKADPEYLQGLSNDINIGNDAMRIIIPERDMQNKIFKLSYDMDVFIKRSKGYAYYPTSENIGFYPWDLNLGIVKFNQVLGQSQAESNRMATTIKPDTYEDLLLIDGIKRSDLWFWMFAVLASGFYTWHKLRQKKKNSEIAGEPGQSIAWNKGVEQAQVSFRSFLVLTGLFFAIYATISFIGFNDYRKSHERSLVASSEAYSIDSVEDFISAVKRPELKYLVHQLSAPATPEALQENIANLARLNDINSAPWLIQLAVGHPEEEVRLLAQLAVEHIRQSQERSSEENLDDMAAYFYNNPMTPEMLERFHGLFVQVYSKLSEPEKASAVKLHIDIAPSYLMQTESEISEELKTTGSEQTESAAKESYQSVDEIVRSSEELNATGSEQTERETREFYKSLDEIVRLSEESGAGDIKGFAEYVWEIARTSPQQIADNKHAIALLESQESISASDEYRQWKQEYVEDDADLSDLLEATIAALFIIGIVFYIRSLKTPEKILDRIDANPKNNMPEKYLEKLSVERELDDDPKITRGLLRTYIRLKMAEEQAEILNQTRSLRGETPAYSSIAYLAQKRAELIAQTLASRYLKRTSLINHLEKAHGDIMEEYPGCFDILHGLYRSDNMLDNISSMKWLVPIYSRFLNSGITSRSDALKYIIAIMALHDTRVKNSKNTIKSAIDIQAIEGDLAKLKGSKIMPRHALVRMGCSRHSLDVVYHADQAPKALTDPAQTTLTDVFSNAEFDIREALIKFGKIFVDLEQQQITEEAVTKVDAESSIEIAIKQATSDIESIIDSLDSIGVNKTSSSGNMEDLQEAKRLFEEKISVIKKHDPQKAGELEYLFKRKFEEAKVRIADEEEQARIAAEQEQAQQQKAAKEAAEEKEQARIAAEAKEQAQQQKAAKEAAEEKEQARIAAEAEEQAQQQKAAKEAAEEKEQARIAAEQEQAQQQKAAKEAAEEKEQARIAAKAKEQARIAAEARQEEILIADVLSTLMLAGSIGDLQEISRLFQEKISIIEKHDPQKAGELKDLFKQKFEESKARIAAEAKEQARIAAEAEKKQEKSLREAQEAVRIAQKQAELQKAAEEADEAGQEEPRDNEIEITESVTRLLTNAQTKKSFLNGMNREHDILEQKRAGIESKLQILSSGITERIISDKDIKNVEALENSLDELEESIKNLQRGIGIIHDEISVLQKQADKVGTSTTARAQRHIDNQQNESSRLLEDGHLINNELILKQMGANMNAKYIKAMAKSKKVNVYSRAQFIKDEIGIHIGNGRYLWLLTISKDTLMKKKGILDELNLPYKPYFFKMSEMRLREYALKRAQQNNIFSKTSQDISKDLKEKIINITVPKFVDTDANSTRPRIQDISFSQKLRQCA